MILHRNMYAERMFTKLKQQMSKSTPKLVFVLIKGLLNFCNFSAKTTILMAKISLETKRMTSRTMTLSKLQPKKLEIYSYF